MAGSSWKLLVYGLVDGDLVRVAYYCGFGIGSTRSSLMSWYDEVCRGQSSGKVARALIVPRPSKSSSIGFWTSHGDGLSGMRSKSVKLGVADILNQRLLYEFAP